MHELGRNNTAVMGNDTWFSEVHGPGFFLSLCSIADAETATEDTGWTEISVWRCSHACSIFALLQTIGAKSSAVFPVLHCMDFDGSALTFSFLITVNHGRVFI